MNWSVIAKYIFGELNQQEQEEAEKWIHRNPENKRMVENLSFYLNHKKMETKNQNINVDKAWEKFKNRIEESGDTVKETPVISLQQRMLRYAAALFILVAVGTLAYFSYTHIYEANKYVSIETGQTEKKDNLYLPDGSIASLNGNSEIFYPKEFGKKERFVNVNGEAFFDVQKDASKPFIIRAKEAEIKVLGTSFNVRTNLPDNAVEVFVKSGKVKFYKENNEETAIILEPGYVGLLRDNELLKRKNNDINYLAWKTGKLMFKDNSLESVVEKLNHAYNVKINIKNPEVASMKLSATFKNESIDKILEVITHTLNLKLVEKRKNVYILKEKAI